MKVIAIATIIKKRADAMKILVLVFFIQLGIRIKSPEVVKIVT